MTCEHDWRYELNGVQCNLCGKVATIEWLLDEIAAAESDRARRVEAERLAQHWHEQAAHARHAALEEAAGVCDQYEAEMHRRDERARVHAAGVGADEEAAFTCAARIRALKGGG